jgi:hypothetical protein
VDQAVAGSVRVVRGCASCISFAKRRRINALVFRNSAAALASTASFNSSEHLTRMFAELVERLWGGRFTVLHSV